MIFIPHTTVRHLARPSFWIVVATGIAIADLVAPAQADLCVALLVVLPLMWRVLHRRYVPLLTVVLIIATIVPGLIHALSVIWADQSAPAAVTSTSWPLQPARVWTLLTLLTAGLFHTNLQHSRRRRLALRRELQQRVRQRSAQLQRVNFALRSEIARREETQHLLARSETNLQALIDRMQLQVLRKDNAGVITYANETFCQQLGRAAADVVGCTDEDLYPIGLATIYRADDRRVMTTGRPIDQVEQHPTPDGQTGYVQVFKAPEYDQAGRCTGIQVIFWDVTQKHRSEIALRNSEARKRALFDSVGDAVLLVDHQHRIVEANPSAAALFARSASELVTRLLEEIAMPRSTNASLSVSASSSTPAEQDQQEILAWDSLPRLERCEVTIVRDDQSTFESEVSLHPVPIGNVEGVAIIVRDVTLRRQAFEALREAKGAAEAASRTKSEFMAGVSHELRTPLGGIMGLSELLAATPISAKGHKYVEMIRHSASLLGDVIEDILDFAALEAGRVQINLAPIDLHAVVGDAFKTLAARAIGKPIHLIFSVAPNTPNQVIADAKRLRQVVINLAGNAIKFTPSGEVHVRLSMVAPLATWSDKTNKSHDSANTQTVILDVIDTGVGIPLDKQPRVFDAFERGEASTTRRFGGTGLGLSISDGLVRRLGGRIDLESKVSIGSRFRCSLPLEVIQPETSNTFANLPHDALVSLEDSTLEIAVNEMLNEHRINVVHRLPKRKPTSKRSLIWLLDSSSRFVEQLRRQRRPQDTVIWWTRLGQPLPSKARLTDPILVEPVLPSELLAVLSGQNLPVVHGEPVLQLEDLRTKAVGSRLLIVDDSEVNRVLLHDQLTAAGYEVDIACNGTEACTKAIQRTYECILMDLQMPDIDGTDATRSIRAFYQSRQQTMPPVIALTAHVTDQHRQQCIDAGMNGFLTKPIDRHTLLRTIAEMIGASPANLRTLSSTSSPLRPDAPEWQKRLSELAGNDPESICSVCNAFLEEVPSLSERLSTAVRTADMPSATRAAHTLKSCLKHVARDDETVFVGRLEQQSSAGILISASDLTRVTEIVSHWIDEVRQFERLCSQAPEFISQTHDHLSP